MKLMTWQTAREAMSLLGAKAGMTDEDVRAAKARAAAFAARERSASPPEPPVVEKPPSSSQSTDLKYGMGAFPGVVWADTYSWSFGSVRTICVSAWLIFLLLPGAFFLLVRTLPAAK